MNLSSELLSDNKKYPRVILAVFFMLFLQINAFSDQGGIYVSGSIAEPKNLIPILASDSASHNVTGYIFNGLLKYNPSLELEGDLALNYEILNEGKTIIFYLRKDVMWHDGHEFTAEDVEFTYLKLIDPKVPTAYSGDFEKVDSLTVLDPYTVRVDYKESFSPALSSWTMHIIPKHILKNEDFTKTKFSRNPIGTGPYRFGRWIDNERVELTVFEDYFEGRPKIDKVIIKIIPDQTTMFLELHQETVDQMGLTPIQYSKLTGSRFFKERFQKFRTQSFGYTYMGYNLTNPLFEDKRVRQALNYAVDKEEIIKGVLLGLGRVCTGPFTPESWAYDHNLEPAPFDPEKSKELLKEAGWEDTDSDGILDKDGKPFRFTVTTNQANFTRQLTAEIIQRRLRQVGVSMDIKVIEWAAFVYEFIDKRKFEAVLLGWGLARDPDPYDIWHSSKTNPGEFNFIAYKNETVDRLIDQGRRIYDTGERAKVYRQVHRILYDDQPVMFLFVPDALPIVHSRFKNIEVTPIGIGYNFIDWEVPLSHRKYLRYSLND